jgi:hypothetical protein
LLIPSDLLSRWLPITKSVANLAYAFDVSEEAMAVKVKQSGSNKTAFAALMPLVSV